MKRQIVCSSLAVALMLTLAATSCTGTPSTDVLSSARSKITKASGSGASPTSTPQSNPNQLTGGIATPSPGASSGNASPSPTPNTTIGGGSPSPGASGGPTTQPYVPYSVLVTVVPATASISEPAPDSSYPEGLATTVQLSSSLLNSDGSSTGTVAWTSSITSIATVSATGLVTAGSQAGTATITATSPDGRATASCLVTVAANAGLNLSIQ